VNTARWSPPSLWRQRGPHWYAAASLLLHAGLLALAPGTTTRVLQGYTREEAEWLNPAPAEVERSELQRRVEAMERLQHVLAGSPAPAASAPAREDTRSLLERARSAEQRVRELQEQQRAAELSKLLHIPLDKALQQLRAQTPPRIPHAHPLAEVHDLERSLQRSAQRLTESRARQRNGAPVSGGPSDTELDASFIQERAYTDARPRDAQVPMAHHLATGRSFGPGGRLADRVYINTWYVIGPFEGGMGQEQPPETLVDLDAVYRGAEGLPLHWRFVQEPRYPMVPQPEADDAVYYAYTELRVDRAQDVWFDVGADDDAKLWLNDRLVWAGDGRFKPWYRQPFTRMKHEMGRYGLVEDQVPVHLEAGRNTVLLKLYNSSGLMFFSLVLRPGTVSVPIRGGTG
jgi:hypothetical protein